MKQIFEFKFQGQSLEFDLGEKDVMVNATQMAAMYAQKPQAYLRQKKTKKIIEDLKNTPFRDFNGVESAQLKSLNTVSPSKRYVVSVDHTIILKNNKAQIKLETVWMHRYLALDFAAWLDTNFNFQLWLHQTIDNLIYEYRPKINQSMNFRKEKDALGELVVRLKKATRYQQLLIIEQEVDDIEKEINSAGPYQKNTSKTCFDSLFEISPQ